MNALVEEGVIRALYAASQAGVQIDLIVRGACALRPGVPGVSENIRVRSILGRFLEHHRVWFFENDGEPDVWLASADWMGRNLFRRIEVAFPVLDPVLRKRVVDEGLKAYLADNRDAWELDADGRWSKVKPRRGAQAALGAGANCWRACAHPTISVGTTDGPHSLAALRSGTRRARPRPPADVERAEAGRTDGRMARRAPAGHVPHPGVARRPRAADGARAASANSDGAGTRARARRVAARARAPPIGPIRASRC